MIIKRKRRRYKYRQKSNIISILNIRSVSSKLGHDTFKNSIIPLSLFLYFSTCAQRQIFFKIFPNHRFSSNESNYISIRLVSS